MANRIYKVTEDFEKALAGSMLGFLLKKLNNEF